MPFLPEELCRPKKKSRTHLPTHHISPLVDQDRQIAPRLDPLGVHGTDDCFAGRSHNERLLKFAGRNQFAFGVEFQAMMRDNSAFLGKSLNMLRFLFKIGERNE